MPDFTYSLASRYPTPLNRRNLLKGAMVSTAASFVSSAAASASASVADPELIALIERHRALIVIAYRDINKADKLHRDYDPTYEEIVSQHWKDDDAIMLEIARFPTVNNADLKAKIEYLKYRIDTCGDCVADDLYPALLRSLSNIYAGDA